MLGPSDIEACFSSKIAVHATLPICAKLFLLEVDEELGRQCLRATQELRHRTGQQSQLITTRWVDVPGMQRGIWTSKDADCYCVCINWRFFATVYFLAHRMYSTPDFHIQGIETPDDRDQTLKSIRHNIIDLGVEFRTSQSFQRQVLADNLAINMVSFLFFHEVTHVRGMHFGYQAKFNRLLDGGPPEEANSARISLQALEAEADRQALLNMLASIAVQAMRFRDISSSAPEILPVYRLLFESQFKICTYAGVVFSLLLAFPDGSWSGNEIYLRSHPINPVRQMLLMRQLEIVANARASSTERPERTRTLVGRVMLISATMITMMNGEAVNLGLRDLDPMEVESLAERVLVRQEILANEILSKEARLHRSSDIFQSIEWTGDQ